MTKLAFSFLFFFSLSAILQSTSHILAAPVTGEQSSLWSGDSSRYGQDGTHLKVENHMDRSTLMYSNHDLNAGNPLESDESLWRNINVPAGPLQRQQRENLITNIMTACRVADVIAERIFRKGFYELSEEEREDALSRFSGKYIPACEKMRELA